MKLPLAQVDAFTAVAFGGNPAAVCLLPEARDATWMQAVASEMNLGATAFVRRLVDGFELRWFTPTVELELCGHGTLASAHVLWESGELAAAEPARFRTRGGLLAAAQRGEWIELDFPATPDEPAAAPPGLVEALGASPAYVGKSRFDYLVELDGEEAVRALSPDLRLLGRISARGVMVTSRSASPGYDFVSRFFAPAAGIDEDPATGSAHCCLGPFWRRRLGRSEFLARQVSARGGVVRVRLDGDRALLGGQAVTVWRGELFA
jgi:predicted PhzF superfamily epimerase YddE/YHI9